jgi:hypothetical protein
VRKLRKNFFQNLKIRLAHGPQHPWAQLI